MSKDILFLLKPDFYDGKEGPFFCPECAEMLGMLNFYPKLKDLVEVRWADYPRPRPEVIEFTGEEHQSCPVLILAQPEKGSTDGLTVCSRGNQRFISGAKEISAYLARTYGTGRHH